MLKKISALITAVSLVVSAFAFSMMGSAANTTNWMGSIADNRSLASLSIPGTHDSGARYEPVSGTAKCQDKTISEQLTMGVRYLDIRCRHIDNAFTIHHGSIYQKINFQGVLDDCYNFLNANPSETIIMSVKEEHTSENITRSFEETFNSYVNANPSKWYLGDSVPNLGEVRGKIVLVRRFGCSGVKGINCTNWADNTTFTTSSAGTTIKVQDQYVVPNNSNKWSGIESMLNEAKNNNPSWLYLNYSSGYKSLIFGIPSITTVSKYMNPKLETYFSNNTSGRFGVVVMDFATQSICEKIIATN